MEKVPILNKDGNWEEVMLQYDTGAQSSCISSSLAKRAAHTSQRGNFTIKGVNGKATHNNMIHSLTINTPSQEVEIEGLGINNLNQNYNRRTIPLLRRWRRKHRLKQYLTPEGVLEVLLGGDALRYHPVLCGGFEENKTLK